MYSLIPIQINVMTRLRQDSWVVWVGENNTGNVTAIYQINIVLLFPKNFMFFHFRYFTPTYPNGRV